MDKGSSANSQNPTMRSDNPFANLPNNDSTNGQSVAGSDAQLEELRKRVDDSAYANSAYDRANAFSVTNTREQPNIGIGGSATSFGGIKDTDLEFLSVAEEEPEPLPEPEPVLEPLPPEPIIEPEPQPAPQPAPQIPEEAPRQEQLVQVPPAQVPPIQPQPMPQPQPAPATKEKGGLSLPIIIVIVIVALALIGLAIWAILALRNRNNGGTTEVDPPVEPAPTEETIGLEEYNRRIDAKEELSCTATYSRASYTGVDYNSGDYEIYSEKAWTIAADEGWKHVYVTNYDFRFNLKDGSALAAKNLRNSPASIYLDDQDAYLWSVTLTPRAGGDGTATYRLASYETGAPSLKLGRTDVESSFTSDFYETIKVSNEEFNDEETGSINFVCKQGGISNYQEFIDARKAEIGAGDAQ
jgi:hypothetical protein